MISPVRTFLFAALLGLAGSGIHVHAAGIQDEPRYEIRVKNISVHSLVISLANIGKFEVVTGDELKHRRIDVIERTISPSQLLARIAKDQNLVVRTDRGLRLIASPCRLSVPPVLPDEAAFRKSAALKVTMNFQGVTAGVLTELFADVTAVPVNVEDVNTNISTAMFLKDRPAGEFIATVATVQGWSMTLAENGALRFVPDARLQECGAPAVKAGQKVEAPITRKTPMPAPTCRSGTRTNCMPLEYFALELLRPLGYVRSLSDSKRVVLIEVREGVVYPAKVGDYMGANYGRIEQITDNGIVLNEVVQNPDATRKERRKTINYQ